MYALNDECELRENVCRRRRNFEIVEDEYRASQRIKATSRSLLMECLEGSLLDRYDLIVPRKSVLLGRIVLNCSNVRSNCVPRNTIRMSRSAMPNRLNAR